MSEKSLDFDFVKSLQASLEDSTSGTDSAIEAISRLRKVENPTNVEELRARIEANAGPFSPKVVFPEEKNSTPKVAAPKPAEEKVITRVVYKGHRYNGDFFSMVAVALIELNNPKINEVMRAWAFVFKDLDENKIFPPEKRKKSKRSNKNKQS